MKSRRLHKNAEGDVRCRLSGKAGETMDHVINYVSETFQKILELFNIVPTLAPAQK